jgi:hypothetical protein
MRRLPLMLRLPLLTSFLPPLIPWEFILIDLPLDSWGLIMHLGIGRQWQNGFNVDRKGVFDMFGGTIFVQCKLWCVLFFYMNN